MGFYCDVSVQYITVNAKTIKHNSEQKFRGCDESDRVYLYRLIFYKISLKVMQGKGGGNCSSFSILVYMMVEALFTDVRDAYLPLSTCQKILKAYTWGKIGVITTIDRDSID